MGRAAAGVEVAGLSQAERAVDRVPDIRRVSVFLTIVFPPANGA